MLSTYRLGECAVHRMGFGAMQLAGPGVFGPPRDREAAVAVLRRAVELGVDHIDTSQYYGPDVVNELIRPVCVPTNGVPHALTSWIIAHPTSRATTAASGTRTSGTLRRPFRYRASSALRSGSPKIAHH